MDGMAMRSSGAMPDAQISDTDSQGVLQGVCIMLAPFNRHDIPLGRETKIAEEMDVDSVAIFDIIMDVEDNYDITFPMEAISEIKTIGELTDTIESLRAR